MSGGVRRFGPLVVCLMNTGWWFRLFGWGLSCIYLRERTHCPLFSERYNLGTWRYSVQFGDRWKVHPLKPIGRGQ